MIHNKSLFVDSSSWISLVVKTDSNFQKAASVFSSFDNKTTLYISTLIVIETITKIRKMLGQEKANSLFNQFKHWEKSRSLIIFDISREIINQSIVLLQQHPTPNTFSLTDATNIVLMKQYKIPVLFSFNKDFKKLKIPHISFLP